VASTVEQLEARVVALEARARVLEMLACGLMEQQAKTPLLFYSTAVRVRNKSPREMVQAVIALLSQRGEG
jgi:hypothetical protein